MKLYPVCEGKYGFLHRKDIYIQPKDIMVATNSLAVQTYTTAGTEHTHIHTVATREFVSEVEQVQHGVMVTNECLVED